jgi:NAD(P)-binding Rossmann-like domain
MAPSLESFGVSSSGDGPSKPANWVPLAEQALFTPRKIRLVCVGAGFSGLMLAYKIKHALKIEDFVDLCIYDKNADVGGTWFENKYPGVAW